MSNKNNRFKKLLWQDHKNVMAEYDHYLYLLYISHTHLFGYQDNIIPRAILSPGRCAKPFTLQYNIGIHKFKSQT